MIKSNNLRFHFGKVEKEEQCKLKSNRRKETKIIGESNKTENRKTIQKINENERKPAKLTQGEVHNLKRPSNYLKS